MRQVGRGPGNWGEHLQPEDMVMNFEVSASAKANASVGLFKSS